MDVQSLLSDLNANVATVQSDVNSLLSANKADHGRFDDTLKAHSEALKMLDRSIRGNGKAGLNERMNRAEWFIRGVRRFRWLLIATAATTIGATILTVIIAFLQQGARP